MAINRQMPPNLLDMFKQPKVLFQEAIQRVNTTLNFQAYHRDRWLKYQHEKVASCHLFLKITGLILIIFFSTRKQSKGFAPWSRNMANIHNWSAH
jgi:hypothetical protein